MGEQARTNVHKLGNYSLHPGRLMEITCTDCFPTGPFDNRGVKKREGRTHPSHMVSKSDPADMISIFETSRRPLLYCSCTALRVPCRVLDARKCRIAQSSWYLRTQTPLVWLVPSPKASDSPVTLPFVVENIEINGRSRRSIRVSPY
jgi:hypothetical protein